MNCARQTMTRTSQRFASPEGGGSSGSGRSAATGRDDTGPPVTGSGWAEGDGGGGSRKATKAEPRLRFGGRLARRPTVAYRFPSAGMRTCVRMHARPTRSAALRLVAEGHNDAEIDRRLGVPRRTVRDWRCASGTARSGLSTLLAAHARPCRWPPADYAELLGLYLGDGHITDMPRTQRLRIFLDAKYPASSRPPPRSSAAACPPTASALARGGDHGRRLHPPPAPRLPVSAARAGQEARARHGLRAMAACPRRGGAVGVPPRLHPLGRLHVRQPLRPLCLPLVRVPQPLRGIKALFVGDLRSGGRALPHQRRPRPHLPAAERGSCSRSTSARRPERGGHATISAPLRLWWNW